MDENDSFLKRVYEWGVREPERGCQSDLSGAAKYYAYVILGDDSLTDGILAHFERVYEQGRTGQPFCPVPPTSITLPKV